MPDIAKRAELGVALRTAVCLVTLFAAIEFHELVHLAVGRMAGLPAHFLSLTSVGVEPDEVARAAPAALAWMNGVAPIVTMVLGFLAFAVLSASRRRLEPLTAYVLTWIAIMGVPYVGYQLMATAAPIQLRGDGGDSAAVIGGYFHAPPTVRVILAVAGGVLYVASGFWLNRLLADSPVRPHRGPSLAARLSAVAVWRRLLAAALGILLIGGVVKGTGLLLRDIDDVTGLTFLAFSAIIGWLLFVALLVPWRRPGAAAVWRHWLVPGLLANSLLMVVGFAFPSDYKTFGIAVLNPLLAAAWCQAFLVDPLQPAVEQSIST